MSKRLQNWLTVLVLGAFIVTLAIYSDNVKNEPILEENTDTATSTPEEAKMLAYVANLAKNEGCSKTGTLDNAGGKIKGADAYSYGKYCYKPGTFKYFVREYFGYDLLPQAEDAELMNWITDDTFTTELTVKILSHSPKNWVHWTTTVKYKIGMPPNLSA